MKIKKVKWYFWEETFKKRCLLSWKVRSHKTRQTSFDSDGTNHFGPYLLFPVVVRIARVLASSFLVWILILLITVWSFQDLSSVPPGLVRSLPIEFIGGFPTIVGRAVWEGGIEPHESLKMVHQLTTRVRCFLSFFGEVGRATVDSDGETYSD